MALELLMPQFDCAGQPGAVLEWLVAEGDPVTEGQALARVEGNKTLLELEAFTDGVVRAIVVPAGQAAWPHTILAVLAAPDEDIAALLARARREREQAPPPARSN